MTHVERLHRQGILRQGSPRSGFRYRYASGGRPPAGDLQRILSLRLPPAWRDVAISPSPAGRVQAVGRDAAGRWQYVYHPTHVRRRERQKQERLVRFGAALPRLRRAMARDLRQRGLTRDKVLATICRILTCACLRPGSEAYAAENGTYGLATLRRKHTRVEGHTVHFDFVGKAGKRHRRSITDRQVGAVVRALMRLPGYELFKYLDEEGRVVDIRRADINQYIKLNMGAAFSAKDFRTWSGTLICACALARAGVADGASRSARRRCVVAAIRETAEQLGNTPAVCRTSYISPHVLSCYEQGQVLDAHVEALEELISHRIRNWHRCEKALLRLLVRAAQA